MHLKVVALLAAVCLLSSCTHTGATDAGPERGMGPKAGKKRSSAATKGSKVQPTEAKPVMGESVCVELGSDEKLPPLFLADPGVVVTNVLKPCVTIDGKHGFEKGTPWMAMGFPCTGGGGKIGYTGYLSNPKMITFDLSNSCPMKPADRQAVDQAGRQALGLTADSKLLAYYPFALQYWELVDYPDADTGYVVEVRSPSGRQDGWRKFNAGGGIKVRFYGRENAWVRGNHLYFAEVVLKRSGARNFRIELVSAKALTDDEVAAVRSRCEALRPPRGCEVVFSP